MSTLRQSPKVEMLACGYRELILRSHKKYIVGPGANNSKLASLVLFGTQGVQVVLQWTWSRHLKLDGILISAKKLFFPKESRNCGGWTVIGVLKRAVISRLITRKKL
jgi:hypothetical protein